MESFREFGLNVAFQKLMFCKNGVLVNTMFYSLISLESTVKR